MQLQILHCYGKVLSAYKGKKKNQNNQNMNQESTESSDI